MNNKEFCEIPHFEMIILDTENIITASDNTLPFESYERSSD